MLAQPFVLAIYALVNGARCPVLAHVPSGPDHPELLEVGLGQDADGCWHLLEVELSTVEIEVTCAR